MAIAARNTVANKKTLAQFTTWRGAMTKKTINTLKKLQLCCSACSCVNCLRLTPSCNGFALAPTGHRLADCRSQRKGGLDSQSILNVGELVSRICRQRRPFWPSSCCEPAEVCREIRCLGGHNVNQKAAHEKLAEEDLL